MTTEAGRERAIHLLSGCPTIEALRRAWGMLGVDYQRDPAVSELKDKMKASFERSG